MVHLSDVREGQSFRIRRIKGHPTFHRWFQRIGLKLDSVFEIRRVIPLILSNEVEQPATWLEIMVNGHLIRLSAEEFSCLYVVPCLDAASIYDERTRGVRALN